MEQQKQLLRIGYDAKRIVRNIAGPGSYGRFLVKSMAAHYPELELLLSAPEEGIRDLYSSILSYPNVELLLPPDCLGRCLPFYKSYWRNSQSIPQLRGRGIDIYHALCNDLPSNASSLDVPIVLTVHDLAYERYPDFFAAYERRLMHHRMKQSLKLSSKIIAVSEHTKEEICNIYGVSEEKIEVIYQSCDERFRRHRSPFEIDTVTGEYLLPPRYLLTVGNIERRKNHALIVRALAMLKDRSIPLVIVGQETDYAAELKSLSKLLGVSHRLIFVDAVPAEDLPAMYQGATLFIYPSLYEGFGIPILEAMASATATIVCGGSGTDEAAADAALYTDPHDPAALAKKIDRLLSHQEERRNLAERGQRHSLAFSSKKHAEKLYTLYRALLGRS